MGRTISKTPKKSTFRRLDKYLYVARTLQLDPSQVIAVCVMSNCGRQKRTIAKHLNLPESRVRVILVAAEPFLRKRRA
jgi:hypothetical protein